MTAARNKAYQTFPELKGSEPAHQISTEKQNQAEFAAAAKAAPFFVENFEKLKEAGDLYDYKNKWTADQKEAYDEQTEPLSNCDNHQLYPRMHGSKNSNHHKFETFQNLYLESNHCRYFIASKLNKYAPFNTFSRSQINDIVTVIVNSKQAKLKSIVKDICNKTNNLSNDNKEDIFFVFQLLMMEWINSLPELSVTHIYPGHNLANGNRLNLKDDDNAKSYYNIINAMNIAMYALQCGAFKDCNEFTHFISTLSDERMSTVRKTPLYRAAMCNHRHNIFLDPEYQDTSGKKKRELFGKLLGMPLWSFGKQWIMGRFGNDMMFDRVNILECLLKCGLEGAEFLSRATRDRSETMEEMHLFNKHTESSDTCKNRMTDLLAGEINMDDLPLSDDKCPLIGVGKSSQHWRKIYSKMFERIRDDVCDWDEKIIDFKGQLYKHTNNTIAMLRAWANDDGNKDNVSNLFLTQRAAKIAQTSLIAENENHVRTKRIMLPRVIDDLTKHLQNSRPFDVNAGNKVNAAPIYSPMQLRALGTQPRNTNVFNSVTPADIQILGNIDFVGSDDSADVKLLKQVLSIELLRRSESKLTVSALGHKTLQICDATKNLQLVAGIECVVSLNEKFIPICIISPLNWRVSTISHAKYIGGTQGGIFYLLSYLIAQEFTQMLAPDSFNDTIQILLNRNQNKLHKFRTYMSNDDNVLKFDDKDNKDNEDNNDEFVWTQTRTKRLIDGLKQMNVGDSFLSKLLFDVAEENQLQKVEDGVECVVDLLKQLAKYMKSDDTNDSRALGRFSRIPSRLNQSTSKIVGALYHKVKCYFYVCLGVF